jgi:hypothetical protein
VPSERNADSRAPLPFWWCPRLVPRNLRYKRPTAGECLTAARCQCRVRRRLRLSLAICAFLHHNNHTLLSSTLL